MLNSFICSKDIQYKDYKNVNLLDNFNVFFLVAQTFKFLILKLI